MQIIEYDYQKSKKKMFYIDETIMEIEAKSGGNGGESLLDFLLNDVSDDLFDVRTTSGVEVTAELSGGEVEGEKERDKKQQ